MPPEGSASKRLVRNVSFTRTDAEGALKLRDGFILRSELSIWLLVQLLNLVHELVFGICV